MKTILVPTDFSACAANAYRLALEIAAFAGAEIHVLHVLYPNEGVDNNIYSAFWADDYLFQRNKELSNWTRRLRHSTADKQVNVHISCAIGFPVMSICDKAKETGADLVVMGTTGATGLRGVFLGSIAAGVMSKIRTPVLAIPKKAALKRFTTAVFATDYRFRVYEGSMNVLKKMLEFQGNRLKIVHILDKPGEKPDSTRETNLRHKMEGIDTEFDYLHDLDIPQAISNYMEAVDAGLLVAVAHDHSLLHILFNDSITRRLAHRTTVPLLVLHDNA